MASYQRRGRKWRARVWVRGIPDSATFGTKAEAVAWATQREAELTGAKLVDRPFMEAMRRYAKEVSPTKEGARWEQIRLNALEKYPIAGMAITRITANDIGGWRDHRLTEVSASTVYRELTLIGGVFRRAAGEWGWIRETPMKGVWIPKPPPSRKRRITDAEIQRLMFGFGLDDGLKADTAINRVGLAFLLCIETGMRAGEALGLTADRMHGKYVHLPKTKNGDARDVPLSPRAREILALVPGGFNLNARTRDTLFRRVRDRCGVEGLHFHDSRAEAIWRLSKKLDVLELARVIGHRDLRSLMIYYETSADDLADRL